MAAGTVVSMFYLGTDRWASSPQGRVFGLSLSLLFFLMAAYAVLSAATTKVELSFDAIETKDCFSCKSLRREEIVGKRIVPTQYISTLVLVPRDETKKKLKIALWLRTNAAFDAWLATIPDLDQSDWAESKTQLEENPELGDTRAERTQRLEQGKRVEKVLNVIAVAISVWGWIFPHPYSFMVLALIALPFISMFVLARGKGLYQMEGRRNDARPSLALPLFFPAAILVLRSVGFNLLQYRTLLVATLALSAGITFAVANFDSGLRKNPWRALLILLPVCMYSYGLIVQANTLPDHSTPQMFQVSVLSKHVSTGRHTSWHLQLGAWGPQEQPSDVSVSAPLYGSVAPGDTVCVALSPGVLKMPWYVVSTCK